MVGLMRTLLLACLLALGCSSPESGPTTTTDAATDANEPADSGTVDTATASDAPPVEGATWDDVYTKVVSTACSSGYCHGGGAGGWSAKDKDGTYAQLVGPSSTQCSGLARVEPGQPEKSALYLKVRGMFTPQCRGNRMPSAMGLPADQIELVRSWIAAGARK